MDISLVQHIKIQQAIIFKIIFKVMIQIRKYTASNLQITIFNKIITIIIK